jgi:hypothetical protein
VYRSATTSDAPPNGSNAFPRGEQHLPLVAYHTVPLAQRRHHVVGTDVVKGDEPDHGGGRSRLDLVQVPHDAGLDHHVQSKPFRR